VKAFLCCLLHLGQSLEETCPLSSDGSCQQAKPGADILPISEHLGRYCRIGKKLRFRNYESELYRMIESLYTTITPPLSIPPNDFPPKHASSLVKFSARKWRSFLALCSSFQPHDAGQVVPSCEEDIELKDLVERAKLLCNPRHVPESVRPPKKISGSSGCAIFFVGRFMRDRTSDDLWVLGHYFGIFLGEPTSKWAVSLFSDFPLASWHGSLESRTRKIAWRLIKQQRNMDMNHECRREECPLY
jgi:hypothetical protein